MLYHLRKSENIAQHYTNNSTFHNITHINFGIIFRRKFFSSVKKIFIIFFEDFIQKNLHKKMRKFFSAASNFLLFYINFFLVIFTSNIVFYFIQECNPLGYKRGWLYYGTKFYAQVYIWLNAKICSTHMNLAGINFLLQICNLNMSLDKWHFYKI